MPTGTPIRDIREQLLAAAERVLLRDGPDALTSRAVATEAGFAKGILHRHFPDFVTFLAALALAHIERLDALATDIRASAGTGSLADNLTRALAAALDPTATGIVSLVCSRHELLARLRLTTPAGIPLLTETTKLIAAYLTAERGLGRIALRTDVDTVAVILVGSAHLLAAGSHPAPAGPQRAARRRPQRCRAGHPPTPTPRSVDLKTDGAVPSRRQMRTRSQRKWPGFQPAPTPEPKLRRAPLRHRLGEGKVRAEARGSVRPMRDWPASATMAATPNAP